MAFKLVSLPCYQAIFGVLSALAVVSVNSVAWADETSPAPAAKRGLAPMAVIQDDDPKKSVEVESMWLATDAAPARAIRAKLTELPKSKQIGSNQERSKRLIIGSSRALSNTDQRVVLSELQWTSLPEGGKAARVRIDIEGATSVRLGYRIEGQLAPSALRFSSDRFDRKEQGREIVDQSQTRWTDIFDGSAAIIDIRLGANETVGATALVIDHAVGLDVGSDLSKRETDIGRAETCNSDVACVSNPSQALINATRSVAKLVFQSGNFTILCSGTLIANTQRRPYIFTANHCINTQAEASSLATYWAFQAASCGSRAIPTFQRITSGANLVFGDPRIDVTLIEMNSSPPNTAVLAGWSADLARRNMTATLLHHPSGDLMKYTTGTTIGYTNVDNVAAEVALPGDKTSSYWTTQWNQGSSEGGSSGAAIMTYEAPGALCAGGCYLVRGALSQGSAECANPSGTDKFARLDLALPYIASYLDANFLPFSMDGTMATEYYNVTNDHYFMTADPAEANSLDQPNTRITGWYRTGEQFGVYRQGTAGLAPVCRFFGDIQRGGPNSHFYTSDAGECTFVARAGSGWLRESQDAFRVAQPIGTACPTGTKPLYRMFNYHNTPTYRNTLTGLLGFDSNHRYFTDSGYFDIMKEKDVWAEEPSGRVPLMCVR